MARACWLAAGERGHAGTGRRVARRVRCSIARDAAKTWLAPWLDGVTRREHLARVDLRGALHGLLDWNQQRRLDELAPTHLAVPSGSRIALDYSGAAPALAVRLQEVFGWMDTPRIAGGRVPVTLELLSPARRPVQVTRDLASFWATRLCRGEEGTEGALSEALLAGRSLCGDPDAQSAARRGNECEPRKFTVRRTVARRPTPALRRPPPGGARGSCLRCVITAAAARRSGPGLPSDAERRVKRPRCTTRAGAVIAQQALAQVGTPYRYGGADPQRGFDCSGLVSYVACARRASACRARRPRNSRRHARSTATTCAPEISCSSGSCPAAAKSRTWASTRGRDASCMRRRRAGTSARRNSTTLTIANALRGRDDFYERRLGDGPRLGHAQPALRSHPPRRVGTRGTRLRDRAPRACRRAGRASRSPPCAGLPNFRSRNERSAPSRECASAGAPAPCSKTAR